MMAGKGSLACRVHYKRLHADTSLDALTEVVAAKQSPAILGGNPAKANEDGFSYWAAEPREVFEFTAEKGDPFSHLQRTLNKYTLNGVCPSMLPAGMFCGGWIGYFAYELGRYIERLPGKAVDDLGMPLIRLGFYDRVIACDHRSDVFWIVAMEMPGDSETPQEKIASLQPWLEQSQKIEPTEASEASIEDIDLAGIRRNMTRERYLAAIRKIKRYIRDGDVYQVNFSHRFEQPFRDRPPELFHWQNRCNPSGYAAYLDAGGLQIVSASPEMFITIHDGLIRTKPIKGTRPRSGAGDPDARQLDAGRFNDLLTSAKEQAELNMIIDLERNDVARICRPGTRRVIQPRTIEACPTVYHAVATIGGELRDDVGFMDVLRAMFPGGSVTGAPKIRAMEIIDELEPTARGVYTGSIGFIGLDGTVCLNIAIRTAIITGGSAFVQTGGGIVADSDPQAEWDETITKARALLAGIEAVKTGCAVRRR
jgi:para-aminobenzoate synthetase component 1